MTILCDSYAIRKLVLLQAGIFLFFICFSVYLQLLHLKIILIIIISSLLLRTTPRSRPPSIVGEAHDRRLCHMYNRSFLSKIHSPNITYEPRLPLTKTFPTTILVCSSCLLQLFGANMPNRHSSEIQYLILDSEYTHNIFMGSSRCSSQVVGW